MANKLNKKESAVLILVVGIIIIVTALIALKIVESNMLFSSTITRSEKEKIMTDLKQTSKHIVDKFKYSIRISKEDNGALKCKAYGFDCSISLNSDGKYTLDIYSSN
jgi:hypothetical protein